MREVELKSVIQDLDAARLRLESAGAVSVFQGRLEDRRYDFADTALAAKDHVLRLRVYRGAGAATRGSLDWKGPTDYDGGYKVREEIAVEVADPAAMVRLLDKLGLQVTMAIDRDIWQYEIHGAVVRLERFPRMDDLVEVEGEPGAIERAIGELGTDRASFTSERLADFVRRFETRTGTAALLSDDAAAGTASYDFRHA